MYTLVATVLPSNPDAHEYTINLTTPRAVLGPIQIPFKVDLDRVSVLDVGNLILEALRSPHRPKAALCLGWRLVFQSDLDRPAVLVYEFDFDN